ncbi:hypothetical protein TH8_17195 [Thalassospira profundimaris]|nr:hypothetical protein TH8_17195 [Thalassospira profundimaris]
MKLTMVEIVGLAAILLAPFVSFFVPYEYKDLLVAGDVSVTEAVNVFIMISFSLFILSKRFFSNIVLFFSKGGYYKSVDINYFYFVDGSVLTRTRYDFLSDWKGGGELPLEDLVWHKKIDSADLLYRMYGRGDFLERNVSSGQQTISPVLRQETQDESGNYLYTWQPTVSPPLRKKEMISYVVEILADKTEVSAFSEEGTKLGFGLKSNAVVAKLTAYAPFGFKFVLVGPKVTLRYAGTLEEVPRNEGDRPIVNVSPDGSIVEVEIQRPSVNYRYWIHYRFEKVSTL